MGRERLDAQRRRAAKSSSCNTARWIDGQGWMRKERTKMGKLFPPSWRCRLQSGPRRDCRCCLHQSPSIAVDVNCCHRPSYCSLLLRHFFFRSPPPPLLLRRFLLSLKMKQQRQNFLHEPFCRAVSLISANHGTGFQTLSFCYVFFLFLSSSQVFLVSSRDKIKGAKGGIFLWLWFVISERSSLSLSFVVRTQHYPDGLSQAPHTRATLLENPFFVISDICCPCGNQVNADNLRNLFGIVSLPLSLFLQEEP